MATRKKIDNVDQAKLAHVEIEYARPPEDAKQNTKEPDWLATMARCHEQGWEIGVAEGAAWLLQLVTLYGVDEARKRLIARFERVAETQLEARGI